MEIVFFFYDCENDILLESKTFPLKESKTINYDMIVSLWLALNYKFSGSGLSEQLKKAQKAEFFKETGEYLEVYRNNLSQGDINSTVPPPKTDPCRKPNAKFEPVTKFTWPDKI